MVEGKWTSAGRRDMKGVEGIIEELSPFRRALRGEDRNALDCLMNKARGHASSCTVVPLLDPMEAVFLSILIEQQKEISSLREALSNDGRTIISNALEKHLQYVTRSRNSIMRKWERILSIYMRKLHEVHPALVEGW